MTLALPGGGSGVARKYVVVKQIFAAPKRSLGQNFLVDPHISRRIVAALRLEPGAPVLELGPGRGALTQILAGHDGPVLALEKDRLLSRWLHQKYPDLGVVQGDGLYFCWEKINKMPGIFIVGNLPYNVASPMIWDLVSRARGWKAMVFMVQKEVAERMTAPEGTRTYGALSAWIANFVSSELLFTVPPQVFRPCPKVESAVVRFEPRLDPAWAEAEDLSWILKILFQKRRKQLGGILKDRWTRTLEAWCAERGVRRQARPEELSPDFLRGLALAVRSAGETNSPDLP